MYPQIKSLKPNIKTKIGGFIIQPFFLFHNAENYGYLIQCSDGTRIVFATDTYKIPYNFKDINCYMVEANYDNDIIIERAMNDDYGRSANQNHMEINDTIDFLKRNYSSSLSQIVLIHLSDGNSDEELFKKRVFEEIGIMPTIANKGVEIELNKEDF